MPNSVSEPTPGAKETAACCATAEPCGTSCPSSPRTRPRPPRSPSHSSLQRKAEPEAPAKAEKAKRKSEKGAKSKAKKAKDYPKTNTVAHASLTQAIL